MKKGNDVRERTARRIIEIVSRAAGANDVFVTVNAQPCRERSSLPTTF
jgi:hypothetical protein